MEQDLPQVPASALKQLESGLEQLALTADLNGPLTRYVRLLLLWNGTYNLTAIRDPAQIVSKHLLDCLAMAPFVEGESLVDVGSGAGFPGIPLALARPGLRVALVETAGKKARFLREVVRQLDLRGRVEVHSARAEDLVVDARFALLTARAFGTVEEILRVGAHLLADDGQLLAMKGKREELLAEPVPEGFKLRDCHSIQVPGLDAERHLAVVVREP